MRLRGLAFIVRALVTILGVPGWWLQTRLRKDTQAKRDSLVCWRGRAKHHCSRMALLQCLGGSRDICDLTDGRQKTSP